MSDLTFVKDIIDIRDINTWDAIIEASLVESKGKKHWEQLRTPEALLLTLDLESGVFSYSWPRLNKIDRPSPRLIRYAKRRKHSGNPISYLWYLFKAWFTK
jgi:hypothetical protein